jgi:hypothetical protein
LSKPPGEAFEVVSSPEIIPGEHLDGPDDAFEAGELFLFLINLERLREHDLAFVTAALDALKDNFPRFAVQTPRRLRNQESRPRSLDFLAGRLQGQHGVAVGEIGTAGGDPLEHGFDVEDEPVQPVVAGDLAAAPRRLVDNFLFLVRLVAGQMGTGGRAAEVLPAQPAAA